MMSLKAISFNVKTSTIRTQQEKEKIGKVAFAAQKALDEQGCFHLTGYQPSFFRIITKIEEKIHAEKTAPLKIMDFSFISKLPLKEKIFLKKLIPFANPSLPVVYSLNIDLIQKWERLTLIAQKKAFLFKSRPDTHAEFVKACTDRKELLTKKMQCLLFYFFANQSCHQFIKDAKKTHVKTWMDAPYQEILKAFLEPKDFLGVLETFFFPFLEEISKLDDTEIRYEALQIESGLRLYARLLKLPNPEVMLFLIELSSFEECSHKPSAEAHLCPLLAFLLKDRDADIGLYPELSSVFKALSSCKTKDKSFSNLNKVFAEACLEWGKKRKSAINNLYVAFHRWEAKEISLEDVSMHFNYWAYTLQSHYILGKVGEYIDGLQENLLEDQIEKIVFLSHVNSEKNYRAFLSELQGFETPPCLRDIKALAIETAKLREKELFTEKPLSDDPGSFLHLFIKGNSLFFSCDHEPLQKFKKTYLKDHQTVQTLSFLNFPEFLTSANAWLPELRRSDQVRDGDILAVHENLQELIEQFDFSQYPRKDLPKFLKNLFLNALWPLLMHVKMVIQMHQLLEKDEPELESLVPAKIVDLILMNFFQNEPESTSILEEDVDEASNEKPIASEVENVAEKLEALTLKRIPKREVVLEDKTPIIRARKLREMQKILSQQGFSFSRMKGSHEIWTPEGGGGIVVVPHHAQKEIPRGTRHSIAKQVLAAKK